MLSKDGTGKRLVFELAGWGVIVAKRRQSLEASVYKEKKRTARAPNGFGSFRIVLCEARSNCKCAVKGYEATFIYKVFPICRGSPCARVGVKFPQTDLPHYVAVAGLPRPIYRGA